MTVSLTEPIYSIVSNDMSFAIIEFVPSIEKYERITVEKCYEKVKENGPLFDFFISLMVLLSAEFHQRRAINKKLKPKRINVKFYTLTVNGYLEKLMKNMKISDLSLLDELSVALNSSFNEIKKKLGFPLEDPCKHSYTVTDKVIAAAGGDRQCENYLKSRKNIGLITPSILKEIKEYLVLNHTDKAVEIINELESTEDREHLSIFSIDAEGYIPFVHIVNPDKDQIKMENWKFLLMIENPNKGYKLYNFDDGEHKNRYYKQHKFIFNDLENGKIVGSLNPEKSQFQIIKYDETIDEKHGVKAIFKVDSTYLLCLYLVLKKLKEDKVRFTEYVENAEVEIDSKDIFDRIFFD